MQSDSDQPCRKKAAEDEFNGMSTRYSKAVSKHDKIFFFRASWYKVNEGVGPGTSQYVLYHDQGEVGSVLEQGKQDALVSKLRDSEEN